MRIIAGQHRGRALIGPEDAKTTRPITDRVKEALFNRLVSLGVLSGIDDLTDDERSLGLAAPAGQVLDIFSGTGSLGLEALSRGATGATFVDMDRSAIGRLEKNIQTLGAAKVSRVVATNVMLPHWMLAVPDGSVALAFVDPPYRMTEDQAQRMRVLELIGRLFDKLEPGGVVILRTPRGIVPEQIERFDGPASFPYGTTELHFYQRPLPE